MYKIKLEQEDFLRYQLFTASKSKRIKRKRILSWLLITATMFLLGFMMMQKTEKFLAYYFLAFGIITFIFYPFYQKVYYKKHYLKHINEYYKNRFGQESELSFRDDHIVSVAEAQEGKAKLLEITEINEIADNLFINFKSGDCLIIPSCNIHFNELKQELQANITDLDIMWNKELEWKWG